MGLSCRNTVFLKEDVHLVELLKVCARKKDLHKGTKLHVDIVERGILERCPYVANSLISMYAKCGELSKAQQVFNELPVRNTVSWNALIAGYIQQGKCYEALDCFERMLKEGLSPSVVTFSSILKACGNVGAIDKGSLIHNETVSRGLLKKDIVLGSAIVDMYAKCGMLGKAQQVLDELPVRDKVSFSALITGYTKQGQGQQALNCYERMQREGITPDEITFSSILKACGSTGDINKGKEIHDEIVNKGLLDRDMILGNSLVDMYSKCGSIAKAEQVFYELPMRNHVCWSTLISGYVQQNQGNEALNCFGRMQIEGIHPDGVMFTCMLKACSSAGAVDMGKQIHNKILSMGLLGKDIVLGTSLVDMYAKCGTLGLAQKVFDELFDHNLVSWSALIAGFVQQGKDHEALVYFERMQREGFYPDAVTFSSILKACGSTGAIDKGKQIHDEIKTRDLMHKDIVLTTALVDMYAKCGILEKAEQVLEELPFQDAACWNALVAGYAQQGQGHKALNCLEQMQKKGVSPDDVTILCVLTACSHSGLMDEAQMYFKNMSKTFGVQPTLKHHTCIVDVLGCAGEFEKVVSLIKNMSCSDRSSVWLPILNACRKLGNTKLGRMAFEKAVELDKNNAVYYVLMAEIYSAAGMHEDAKKIEAMGKSESSC